MNPLVLLYQHHKILPHDWTSRFLKLQSPEPVFVILVEHRLLVAIPAKNKKLFHGSTMAVGIYFKLHRFKCSHIPVLGQKSHLNKEIKAATLIRAFRADRGKLYCFFLAIFDPKSEKKAPITFERLGLAT